MAYTPKLTYKGRPLVRCGNEIYYGSLADPYVVFMQVLTTKEENGITVADKLHVMLMSTDATKPLPDRSSGRAPRPACTPRWKWAACGWSGPSKRPPPPRRSEF